MLMDLESTFEFDSACCVDEAFKKLSTKHYNVIISDYEMHQKNGLQFLTELRKKNNEIPFILFTGKGREEVAIQSLNLGADGYINKQGNPETVYGELAHSLRLLADRSRIKLRIAADAVAFQNVENAIITTDQIQTITSWNRAAENVFGYSANETIGKRIEEIFVPMEVDVSFQEVVREIQDKGRFLGDVSYKNKKGELRYGELTIITQMDNCSKISGSTIICHDITLRKKNDLEISQKNEALERVAESIDSGLAVISRDYRVVWANKRLKDLGVAPNKKCYQTFNNLETVCPNCGAKKIFEQNINLDVHEFETVNSKGEKMWIELRCTPLKDKNGKVTATLELAVPITERKKKEQTLRESEEKFRSLAEESPNMIFINCRGRVVYTNKKSEEIMGYSKAEFYSSDFNFLSLISPEYSETLKSAYAKHIKGETVPPYEYVLITKEGKKINAIINTSLIEYNGNKAIMGIVTDITDRKKTEDALTKSEEKYRKLFEESLDGIIIADIETGKILDCNPTATKLVGWQKSALVGQHQSIIHPKEQIEREGYSQGFKEHIKDQSKTIETKIITKTGEIRDVAIKASIIELKGKKLMQGTFRDITERKKAEQNLREVEKRYRTLFSQAPLGVVVIDPDSQRIIEFNNVASAQLGYCKEDFSKLQILDFEASMTEEEIKDHVKKILMAGEDEFETKHRTKNGEVRNVIVTARAIELSGKSFLNCVFHDITDIRCVQNALMESEMKYRQLVDVAQEGIWAFDNSYCTVFANPRMAQMLGYSERELVGKNLREILFSPSDKKTKQLLTQHSDKKSNKRVLEYKLKRKDGSWVYAGLVVSPFKDDNGKVVGTLALVSDITYSKVLERKVDDYSSHLKSMVDLRTVQLKDANERLVKSERLAAIGELAGMVGHDLRNPLAGIKNATYILKKRGNTISENQARETLEIIEKAIDHSDKIISDLLEYAREMRLDITESTISTLVNAAIQMITVPDRVQILNHVNDETTIRVDADKIMRIFINLIKNAIDAIPQRGTIEINSCRMKDCIKIAFTDTGTGIPEDTLPKIFTPLFTTKAQGMGFGLAICKRIIEAHGGTIAIKTEVNKGTTFTVVLPIKPKMPVAKTKLY